MQLPFRPTAARLKGAHTVAKEVIMPALGMSQDTGRLLMWLKSEGDTIEKGEPLMEVETDKTTVEVEAPATGTLGGVSASAGDDVPVGDVVAYILAEGESAPASSSPPPSPEPDEAQPAAPSPSAPSRPQTPKPKEHDNGMRVVSATPVAQRMATVHDLNLSQVPASGSKITRADVEAYLENGHASDSTAPTTPGGVVLASPKARRLADEQNLILADIPGSGPEGAVLADDVLTYDPPSAAASTTETAANAERSAVNPANTDTAPQTGTMWKRMAERLTESWQTVPHFYLKREVDATAFVNWRTDLKARMDVKVTYTDLLVKAVAHALRANPFVNGAWNGQGVVFNDEVNVGLAVAVEQGLLVPVIHHADTLGVQQIAERRAEIVERSLSGKLKPNDLQGGTFTISNLGMFGVDNFNAIVNPPQAAILAVGNITERAVPVNGQVEVRPMMTLSLSCDHRAVDGAHGAQFLATLARSMETPLSLMD